jgi:hypothetical protein
MKTRILPITLTLAALMTALLTGGCVTGPSRAEIDAADYGERAPDSRYADLIHDFLRYAPIYPASAKIDIGEPRQAWYEIGGPDAGENKGVHYGYAIPVIVDHKNGYGDYIGDREWWFFFQDWRLVAYKSGEVNLWFTHATPKSVAVNGGRGQNTKY